MINHGHCPTLLINIHNWIIILQVWKDSSEKEAELEISEIKMLKLLE